MKLVMFTNTDITVENTMHSQKKKKKRARKWKVVQTIEREKREKYPAPGCSSVDVRRGNKRDTCLKNITLYIYMEIVISANLHEIPDPKLY